MVRGKKRSGGRRALLAAAATGVAAVLGVILLWFGVLGEEGGPPQPPAAAAPQEPTPSSAGASSADTPADAGETLGRSAPASLRIPAIDVNVSKTVPLGTQPNGKIEVPEGNEAVGWYSGGPAPGQFGPALMGGHVDSESGPAVFYRLGELRSGDEIMVTREDGKTAVFEVYGVERYPKDDFPTQEVYAPTKNRAELRLITCGGAFNESTQHYRDNIVVYAKMTEVE